MPYLVNGELVPEGLILQEAERLGRDPRWRSIPDEAERARLLRSAAEATAIDKVLVANASVRDPRHIDPGLIEKELKRHEARFGPAVDRAAASQLIDGTLRLQRTMREMLAGAAKPTDTEIEAFYEANRENFRNPPLFHAAHIVKLVDADHNQEQARAGIEAALAELERGEPFAAVVERHSDCKENGGDLGMFPAGTMAAAFEDAIRNLAPGQRTGIFRTPLGFHIAELRAKPETGLATFEAVRADIERVMALMNRHETYLRAVAEMRSRSQIRCLSREEADALAGESQSAVSA